MITNLNIKNLKNQTRSIELAKINNVYGPNGAGKSAIIEAVNIALTGYTSLGKLPGKTIELADGKSFEVSLESDKGNILARKFQAFGSGAKQTISFNGETVKESDLPSVLTSEFNLPLESIHPTEFLSLSNEKRADYIFSSLSAEINQIMPENIEKSFDFFQKPGGFSEILKLFKEKESILKKEVKRCEATVQKLTGQLQELPAGNLQEWREKKAEAKEALEKASNDLATNKERASSETRRIAEINRLNKNISDSISKIGDSERKMIELQRKLFPVPEETPSKLEVDQINEKISSTKEKLAVLRHQQSEQKKKLDALQEGCCPFCGVEGDSLEDATEKIDMSLFDLYDDIEKGEKELKNLQEQRDSKQTLVSNMEQNYNTKVEINVTKDAIEAYKKFCNENTKALEQVENTETKTPVSLDILQGKIDGLKLQIKEADEAIEKFVGAQSVKTQRSEAEAERMELESSLEEIKDSIKEIRAIRDKRLEAAKQQLMIPFNKIAETAFPGGTAFIDLISKDKPCFEFGIIRNEKKISFNTASGGEKGLLLMALVACIQKIKNNECGIGLFEIAEIDDNNFKTLIKAVGSIGFKQVIIASCHGYAIEEDDIKNIDLGG